VSGPADSVTVVRPQERDLQPVREGNPILLQVVADGLEGNPYVHVTEVPAHHHIASHSHSETEVTIILEGTAIVDGTPCGPGTVLVIPADQSYAIDAGDEPLTFAVVRPRKADYAGPK
jgi:quercetin dioxygenase-like cupin family protein